MICFEQSGEDCTAITAAVTVSEETAILPQQFTIATKQLLKGKMGMMYASEALLSSFNSDASYLKIAIIDHTKAGQA